jgi:hypothetical protein
MPNPAEPSAPGTSSSKLFGLIHRIGGTLDADDVALLNAIYVELKASEPAPPEPKPEPKPAKDA